jgi:hypothetical protein
VLPVPSWSSLTFHKTGWLLNRIRPIKSLLSIRWRALRLNGEDYGKRS